MDQYYNSAFKRVSIFKIVVKAMPVPKNAGNTGSCYPIYLHIILLVV